MVNALRGETDVSPQSVKDFAQECSEAAERQLVRERGDFRIRMSGLGRPLCQQVLEKNGIKEDMEYNTLFRFMFGDLTESILMLIMKEAGVEIVDYQRPVELKINDTIVTGTLDVIIRDELGVEKVWDVKSASDWAFNYKFTIVNGFIENSEFRILRDVDSDNNRRYVTAQLIAGTRFIDTPTNLLVIRSAQIVDSDGTANPDNRDFLQYRDTSFMSEFNNLNSQGVPKYYSNWDEDTIVVAPTPDETYTIQLNYILKPEGLSSTNTTTYLSLQFPNGLLYACLVEAYSFLKGPQDLLQLYEQKYKQTIEGFSIEQMGRRRRDEYQSGVPRIGK